MFKKIIALLPVKNEAHILDFSLENMSLFCDHIIVADQMSGDGSRNIYKKYPKVIVVDNKRQGHSNEVRWDLLVEARKLGSNNLIINLDADEFIPSNLFTKFLSSESFTRGCSFKFPWIQLWKTPDKYNIDKFWKNQYKAIAWVDDGVSNYEKINVINDHTNRIPEPFLKKCKKIEYAPILHLNFLFWEKNKIKQAWYKCAELIDGKRSIRRINNAYCATNEKYNKRFLPTPTEWLRDDRDKILAVLNNKIDKSRLKDIYNFFDKYGIEFFEHLEIWDLDELKNEFIKITGREPIVKHYPYLFIKLIELRRLIKRILRPSKI